MSFGLPYVGVFQVALEGGVELVREEHVLDVVILAHMAGHHVILVALAEEGALLEVALSLCFDRQ